MPYARRDDVSLYYERAGEGNPPLVFVHGWCCDHTFFRPRLPLMVVADEPGPINPLPETRLIYEGFAAELQGPGAEAVRRAWVEAA